MDYIRLKQNEKSPALVRFYIIYSEGGKGAVGFPVTGGHGWRSLVGRAAAAGDQRMF